MAEYTLAHVGINAVNSQDALEAAKMFELLFGLTVKEGNSSVFAGTAVEIMKAPYKGTHGHIGIGTPDVAAAEGKFQVICLDKPLIVVGLKANHQLAKSYNFSHYGPPLQSHGTGGTDL